ncbi:hypothetical protein N7495_002049 [Penicillium taxi]|uniref:uncharacterized protein n=1 Tax=Penicillium taxi TaxID=168475 RepID=UPI002545B775|nr:uncharacterized protein N7495_002049 [Penicillium taxi]KAJ5901521.1 hypothetical protein N7495_002049 [Penicillium taxi]
MAIDRTRGEIQPLLPNGHRVKPLDKRVNPLFFLIVCGITAMAFDLGAYMAQAPQTAIFEQIICRKHLEGRLNNIADVPLKDFCKSDLVQSELALVLGYKDGLDVLPTLLLSLPYGVLLDHWGRKPVLYLCVLGILLAEVWIRLVCLFPSVLPLRLVWFSSFWKIIGGGDLMFSSVILTMVADIFNEEERSTALFRIQSCVLIAEIVATPVSAYMMTFSDWIPYNLGLIIMVIGATPCIFLPETLKYSKSMRGSSEGGVDNELTEPLKKTNTTQEILLRVHEFKDSIRFIWNDSNVFLMVIVMFVSILGRPQTTTLLLQYASKKFDWSFARSSLLITLRGIFSLINFLLVMPVLSVMSAKYFDLHGKFKDWRWSQIMGMLSVVGFLMIGIAPVPAVLTGGMVVASVGSAFVVTNLSLITALVRPDHVGTLYSAISISRSLGQLFAGPFSAYLFQLGMHLGYTWIGLPFLFAAFFSFLATLAVWRTRLSRSEDQQSSS